VIYVATVHWRSDAWIEIQAAYLERHITEPFRVFACLEDIDERFTDRFDVVVPAAGPHAGKLNLLAQHILDEADPDDLLMFLDGDAFPIADVVGASRAALQRSELVAIRRDENLGDLQPHPSFCVTTASTWRRLRGDWLSGYGWIRADGTTVTDVGGNLLFLLEASHTTWTPLLRTHQFTEHPIWFGVYGSVVYHHGAGFRPVLSRWDEAERPEPALRAAERLPGVGRPVARWNRRRAERWNTRRSGEAASVSADIRAKIQDPRAFTDLLSGNISLGPPTD